MYHKLGIFVNNCFYSKLYDFYTLNYNFQCIILFHMGNMYVLFFHKINHNLYFHYSWLGTCQNFFIFYAVAVTVVSRRTPSTTRQGTSAFLWSNCSDNMAINPTCMTIIILLVGEYRLHFLASYYNSK